MGGGGGGDVERWEHSGCRQPAFILALIKPLFLSDLKSQLAETSETEFSPELLLASSGSLERGEGGVEIETGVGDQRNGVEGPRRRRDGFVRAVCVASEEWMHAGRRVKRVFA